MNDYLIPGFYLQFVARKEKNIEQRKATLAKSEELLSDVKNRNGAFAGYSEDCANKLEKAAKDGLSGKTKEAFKEGGLVGNGRS